MNRTNKWRILPCVCVATGTYVAAAWGAFAPGDSPKGQAGRKTLASSVDSNTSEAREVAKAFRDLQKAVRNRDEAGPGSKVKTNQKLPERPAKTIQKPAIDSKQLDALVGKSFVEAKVAPARMTTDEEFVRRVSLDITGHLPDPNRIVAFCRDRDRGKRAKLIDRLLETPEYAQNWARYWRDVIEFHSTNQNRNQVRYETLEQWLSGEFARNTTWDEIATKLITARGRNDKDGSVNFSIAQEGAQPVEMAGEVSRIFMGIQIQCAQCHDHPNDAWKRTQFHEFASFFAGMRIRRELDPGLDKKREQALQKEQAKAKGQAKAQIAAMLRPHFVLEETRGKARYGMPDLKDPQKSVPVAPKFFLASSAETIPTDLAPDQRRALAASYVTGQDNPWFARAFVNRVWYVLIGEAFYNPVDDLGPGRTAHAPEVINTLADEWAKGGYDIRWLFRTILNTHAYQREIRSVNTASGRTPFASNCPSRLRADQIYDALSHALDLTFDQQSLQGKVLRALMGGGGKGMKGPFSPREMLHRLFGVDPSTPTDDVLGTIPQALFLMNAPQINRAMQARPDTMLGKLLLATNDNRTVLNNLYLKVLARTPTAAEVETCGSYIMNVGDRRIAFEDILWALVNTTEFVSRR